jgi:MOSC domain-containing protein YiiM
MAYSHSSKRPSIGLSASLVSVAFIIGLLSITRAFNLYSPRITNDLANINNFIHNTNDNANNVNNVDNIISQRPLFKRDKVILSSWLKDTLNNLGFDFLKEKEKFRNENKYEDDNDKDKRLKGVVIRTATKGYDSKHSLPSSALYTTKKNTQSMILVQPGGVQGDYNHYRSTALDSTPDRAVSILTTDILEQLKSAGYTKVQVGDLGENIYVDGVDYKFFEIGKRYKFSQDEKSSEKSSTGSDGVIVEITERIEPCGNLCKLGYINDETIPPAQRFENCKKFLLWLDQKDGLRGWYGKIIGEGGQVQIGNQVSLLTL